MRPQLDLGRWLSVATLILANLVGLAALLYPFLAPSLAQGGFTGAAHNQDASLFTIGLITLCLATITFGMGEQELDPKMTAVLGVLAAVNAVLRAVPGPAGFAAVFVLPVVCGYVYGATFGFLLGAISLLVSALIGAGVGPWLPYQMLAAGWVGMTSAWLPNMKKWPRLERILLGTWGVLWGFSFGALMNVWFWPYIMPTGQTEMYWQQGVSLLETLKRFGVFYIATSLWWDLGRAAGNGLLLWLLGPALLKLLRRFQQRFHFTVSSNAREHAQ